MSGHAPAGSSEPSQQSQEPSRTQDEGIGVLLYAALAQRKVPLGQADVAVSSEASWQWQ